MLTPHPDRDSPMKSYPRKCGTCRERALAPAVVDYDTEVEFDGRAYRIILPRLPVLRCGNCGALVLGDESDEKVSDALRRVAGLLPPGEVRRQREALGLT